MSERPANETADDWVRRPSMRLVWWCLPLAIGVAGNYFASSPRVAGFVWIVSFVWMGTGCILNARRCHRLHCYISGPAVFFGAVALALFAAGIALLGPHSLNNIVSKLNDSSCVALGWAGKPLSRKSKKRSNRPL
jgi:hypothetical protein